MFFLHELPGEFPGLSPSGREAPIGNRAELSKFALDGSYFTSTGNSSTRIFLWDLAASGLVQVLTGVTGYRCLSLGHIYDLWLHHKTLFPVVYRLFTKYRSEPDQDKRHVLLKELARNAKRYFIGGSYVRPTVQEPAEHLRFLEDLERIAAETGMQYMSDQQGVVPIDDIPLDIVVDASRKAADSGNLRLWDTPLESTYFPEEDFEEKYEDCVFKTSELKIAAECTVEENPVPAEEPKTSPFSEATQSFEVMSEFTVDSDASELDKSPDRGDTSPEISVEESAPKDSFPTVRFFLDEEIRDLNAAGRCDEHIVAILSIFENKMVEKRRFECLKPVYTLGRFIQGVIEGKDPSTFNWREKLPEDWWFEYKFPPKRQEKPPVLISPDSNVPSNIAEWNVPTLQFGTAPKVAGYDNPVNNSWTSGGGQVIRPRYDKFEYTSFLAVPLNEKGFVVLDAPNNSIQGKPPWNNAWKYPRSKHAIRKTPEQWRSGGKTRRQRINDVVNHGYAPGTYVVRVRPPPSDDGASVRPSSRGSTYYGGATPTIDMSTA